MGGKEPARPARPEVAIARSAASTNREHWPQADNQYACVMRADLTLVTTKPKIQKSLFEDILRRAWRVSR